MSWCWSRRRLQGKMVSPRVLAALLVLWCVGCGGAPKARLKHITAPDVRIQFKGFSILPPHGPAWSIAWQSPDALVFHRSIESRTHTFMAEAIALETEGTLASPGEFVDSIRRRLPGNWDPERFEDVEHRVELDESRGIWCARIFQRAVDLKARQAPGKRFIFEQYELLCLHPQDRSVAFLVRYSERRLPEEPRDAAALAEGEAYLSTLQVERVR